MGGQPFLDVEALRQAHVGQLRFARAREHDVARLDIAMQQAMIFPGNFQRAGHLADDRQRGRLRQRTFAGEFLVERFAGDIRHRQVQHPAVLAGFIGRDNVRVIDLGRLADLVAEPLDHLLVHRQRRRQDLQRHVTVHRKLPREKYLPHRSLAQLAFDQELSQHAARSQFAELNARRGRGDERRILPRRRRCRRRCCWLQRPRQRFRDLRRAQPGRGNRAR